MMFSVLGKGVVSLLSGYVAKLASKEAIEYILFEVARAVVRNTETKHDDEWLAKFEKLVK